MITFFLEKGYYDYPKGLALASDQYEPSNAEIAKTIDNLILLLKKCKDVAIISDGLNEGR